MHINKTALHGCNGEIESRIPRLDSVFYGVFLLVQLIIAVFGNALVCIAITRFRQLRTPTNYLIFSLAVTDLLTPLVRGVFIGIATVSRKWIFGCFWCQLSSVLGVFLCASSIMHLCAISIERFIVIKWPLRNRLWINKRRILMVLINIWLVSLLLSLFPYFRFVEMTYNVELLDCEILWTKNAKMAIILAAFFFFFPFVIMSLTNSFIYKECRRQMRRSSANCISNDTIDKSMIKSVKLKIRIVRTEFKAVKIIAVVVGVFFILWLPFFVVTCIRAYFPRSVPGTVQRIVLGLVYFNSSCNWIIYNVMNRELRAAFKQMLKIRTAPSERSNIKPSSNWSNSPRSILRACNFLPFAKKRRTKKCEISGNSIVSDKRKTKPEIPNGQDDFVNLKHLSRRYSVAK